MIGPSLINTPWWLATRQFQETSLLNKGVVEALGIDVPMIALARNASERKEVAFKLAVIGANVFLVAPFRGKIISELLGRKVGWDLLKLSFRDLANPRTFQAGLKRIAKDYGTLRRLTPQSRQLTKKLVKSQVLSKGEKTASQALRNQVLQAKTGLLAIDGMLEALVLANLGWVKNTFSKNITGQKNFTGEMNVVDQDTLNNIYEHDKQAKGKVWTDSPFYKYGLPNALAVALPFGLAGLLHHVTAMKPGARKGFWKGLWKIARHFDHNRGYLLGLVPLMVGFLIMNLGMYTNARSDNEKREVLIKKGLIFTLYFFGEQMWLNLLKHVVPKQPGKLTMEVRQAMGSVPKHLRPRAGKTAAGLYWAAFALNTLTVAAAIILNNRWTTSNVKKAAENLKRTDPSQFKLPDPVSMKPMTSFNIPLEPEPPWQGFPRSILPSPKPDLPTWEEPTYWYAPY